MRTSFARRTTWGCWVGLIALTCVLGLNPSPVGAACSIEGPTMVSTNETYTLCGPSGVGYSYEWHGPGIPAGTRTRCITVTGRSSGTYEYELVTYNNGYAQQICTHVVRVGAATGGSLTCQISGPSSIAAGNTAQLCAPQSSLHAYSWSGPGGFTANTRCVTVSAEGVYDLTIRNTLTGYLRQCSHRVDVVGGGSDVGPCLISGPASIRPGGSVQLCGPRNSSYTYRWNGPNGFVSANRCVVVTDDGDYYLTIRNSATGYTDQCRHRVLLAGNGGNYDEDLDAVIEEGSPRALPFWRQQCLGSSSSQRVVSRNDLLQIARCMDNRSGYFNWTSDLDGLCQALSPSRPMTHRKNVARQYAALLANVCAGELDVSTAAGDPIVLDADMRINFRGATTVGELITMVDNLLRSRTGRYSGVAQYLQQLNQGRAGIASNY